MTSAAPRSEKPSLTMSELLSALSCALDMTEGQPAGHCMRVCWIGVHVGRELGLSEAELWELYYVLLMKDLGCSSNAARICELFATDDLAFKHDHKLVDDSLPKVIRFMVGHAGDQSRLPERLKTVLTVLRTGGRIGRELMETRCNRGAEIARKLRFSEAVAAGIRHLDEHWDGGGKPAGVSGEAIPTYARIALLAQVADVFHTSSGPAAAEAEVERRAGGWFDPRAVAAFRRACAAPGFWDDVSSPLLPTRLLQLEPAQQAVPLDEDYLDDIAEAFAQVVDSKSPYTAGHSTRVADIAEAVAAEMGLPGERCRWLRRAALLHDIGKLGVSNTVLDKPGRLDPDERTAVEAHAAYSFTILSRIEAFDELAEVASAHHEKLDGTGYPLGLKGEQIRLETRIISVADFYDALTADRPYRAAMPVSEALSIMGRAVGSAIDADCFAALTRLAAAEAALAA